MDLTLLLAFGASYFLVALSPGLCMTLAMSLGIRFGVRRTLWAMAGEVTGSAVVGVAAVLGVAGLLLSAPAVFAIFKWVGALYLLYMGWRTWQSEPLRPEQLAHGQRHTRASLLVLGFVTAVGNPKAWAFSIALLPPFIDQRHPLAPQLLSLLALMVIIEFTCLLIYARGGQALSDQLHRRGKARWLNYASGTLMVMVGVWLALG
jgi:threonine/homoserine/homoserine lactone efflux protein